MGEIERYLAKPWLAHYQNGVPAAVEAMATDPAYAATVAGANVTLIV